MERQDKYQQILEAAIELFSENGMENTSIQEIAELAGVAKGTIYLYFKSKDDLMEQVYKYCYEMDIKACSRGVQKQKNTIDKLCRRMDNIIDYLLCHPKEARIESDVIRYLFLEEVIFLLSGRNVPSYRSYGKRRN